MLSLCLVPSINKKVISYLLLLEQQPFTALQIQTFHESISIFLKSIETFLIQNYFHSNFKTIQIRQKKNPGQILQ